MKKWFSAAAAGMVMVMLAACIRTSGFDPDTLERSPIEELGTEVTINLSKDAYEMVPEEMNLVITNQTGEEYSYGLDYWLEVQLEDTWYVLPADEELSFAALAVILQADGINSEVVELKQYRAELPDGRYRIVKEFYGAEGQITAAAEFTIQKQI